MGRPTTKYLLNLRRVRRPRPPLLTRSGTPSWSEGSAAGPFGPDHLLVPSRTVGSGPISKGRHRLAGRVVTVNRRPVSLLLCHPFLPGWIVRWIGTGGNDTGRGSVSQGLYSSPFPSVRPHHLVSSVPSLLFEWESVVPPVSVHPSLPCLNLSGDPTGKDFQETGGVESRWWDDPNERRTRRSVPPRGTVTPTRDLRNLHQRVGVSEVDVVPNFLEGLESLILVLNLGGHHPLETEKFCTPFKGKGCPRPSKSFTRFPSTPPLLALGPK